MASTSPVHPRVGLYPGTFDPVTNGHLDIIGRATRLVDQLVVGVATNVGKGPLFSLNERVDLVRAEMAAVSARTGTPIDVRPFDGLLMHFAQAVGAGVIVRGLRAVSDFDYEFAMAGMNCRLDPHRRDRVPDGERTPPVHPVALRQGNRATRRRHLLVRAGADLAADAGTAGAAGKILMTRSRTMQRRAFAAAFLATPIVVKSSMSEAQATDLENTIYLDLKDGRVVIQLLPELAPKAVARVKELCRKGFYDGTPFHRVIEGFMAQGGDPTGTGTGGSGLGNVPAEFTNQRRFLRGTVGAARSSNPNSADSQFFIMFAPARAWTGSTQSGARSCPAWNSWTRSSADRRQRHGQQPRPDRADAGRRRREIAGRGRGQAGPGPAIRRSRAGWRCWRPHGRGAAATTRRNRWAATEPAGTRHRG